MLQMMKSLFWLLSKRERRDFYIMQLMMLAVALAELFSTITILPFMSLAADPSLLEQPYIALLHGWFGHPEHKDFLLILGILFGLLVLLANSLLLLSQFLMNRFSFRLGRELSHRLFRYYLNQDLIFHANTNSSLLVHKTMSDAQTLSGNLFAASLQLNGRIFSILTLAALLFVVNFTVTVAALSVLLLAYLFIFVILRRAITRNSLHINNCDRQRLRWLNEGFEGIKDIKLFGAHELFARNYFEATRASNLSYSSNLLLWASPYYIIESLVLFGVVLITLNFLHSNANMNEALPLLTLFCMAGLKLIPKVQQAYHCLTQIKASMPIYQELYPDIVAANRQQWAAPQPCAPLRPQHEIALEDIAFGYPGAERKVFDHLNINLKAGTTTAIVGPSGSGKSTLLDILMGLIQPQQGCIKVDGHALTAESLGNWRASIGYVPQHVHITDASIAENIAFGQTPDQIDLARVEFAANVAGLGEFIAQLPDRYASKIGERGKLVSGGQAQRIGIARAFYRDISILILDEATSALDAATQAMVLHNIAQLHPAPTVIMVTHRQETLAYAQDLIHIGTNVESSGSTEYPCQSL